MHHPIHHAKYWIIIVQQLATCYIIDPQLTVCTLARAALAEEEIALAVLHRDGGVHEKRIEASRREGEHQHHDRIDGKPATTKDAELRPRKSLIDKHICPDRCFHNRGNLHQPIFTQLVQLNAGLVLP